MKLPTLCVLVFLALPATAQTVWRCGAGVYSDRPCAEGTELDVADPRSDEQRREATLVALRGRQLADDLRAERLQRHAKAVPSPSAATAPPLLRPQPDRAANKPRSKDRARKKHPPAADGTWRASARASRRAKD
jgi:hypothetical protein